MRKNIYVKDTDAELFEWAEGFVSNLSYTITEALRQYRDSILSGTQTEIVSAKCNSFDLDIKISITPKDVSL